MNVTTATSGRRNSVMATFTIDSENNIAAHAEVPASADNLQTFATEKELAKLSAEWPGSRLVEIWNSFAGVTPFGELKGVKKFTNRSTGVARIWEAIQRLRIEDPTAGADSAPTMAKPKKSPAKAHMRSPARTEERSNKKAEVIAMMKRARGATLADIMAATGWQKHTVRGFVSLLGSKGGEKVESTKNAAGERMYRITR